MKVDPIKRCEKCGVLITRNRFTTGRLEDRTIFLKRKFCSKKCQNLAQIKKGTTNKQTMMERARKFKKDKCHYCGNRDRLHIHHIDKNILNNSEDNLMTLCVTCHNRIHATVTNFKIKTDLINN